MANKNLSPAMLAALQLSRYGGLRRLTGGFWISSDAVFVADSGSCPCDEAGNRLPYASTQTVRAL